MRSRQPLAYALVSCALAALLAIYVTHQFEISQAMRGTTVHVVSGELIAVTLETSGPDVVSSDASVVKPVATTGSIPKTFHFVAALPGTATLRAQSPPCHDVCFESLSYYWAIEIEVV